MKSKSSVSRIAISCCECCYKTFLFFFRNLLSLAFICNEKSYRCVRMEDVVSIVSIWSANVSVYFTHNDCAPETVFIGLFSLGKVFYKFYIQQLTCTVRFTFSNPYHINNTFSFQACHELQSPCTHSERDFLYFFDAHSFCSLHDASCFSLLCACTHTHTYTFSWSSHKVWFYYSLHKTRMQC